jgi:hypothetical protein
MISNKKVITYKVIVLIEIYNFDVGDFPIQGRLTNLNFKSSKLQPYYQMISNEKDINYKVVGLIKSYNFGFGRFSI